MAKIKIEKDVVVMRLSRGLKERLNRLAEKRNTTLTSLTSNAIEKFLDEEEFNFQDVLNIVDSIPSLRINREKIETEMKECPTPICKQIIHIIKDKEVFLFEETAETILETIKKIEKKNLYGIFLHITLKDLNVINKTFKGISDILKDKEIHFGAGARGNDHDKILLFVAYNKKET